MQQFCKSCGNKLRDGDKVCIECGTPIQTRTNKKPTQTRANRKPMPKKQKIILSSVIGVLVVIIAFSVWANKYQSPESVHKRFEEAVAEKDSKKLSKLMIHEDGSNTSIDEAKAFLSLVEERGKSVLFDFTSVVEHGNFLLFYTAHKVETTDQFIAESFGLEDILFTFNGLEIKPYDYDGDVVTYGPLTPGIYKVEAQFEGEYGEAKEEEEIILASHDRDPQWLAMDLSIDYVSFYLTNFEEFDTNKAHILLDDEEISINENGETDPVGPLLLNADQEVKTVVEMPWGNIESAPIVVEDSYMEIQADLISEKQYESLVNVLKDFGEKNVEALASQNADILKMVSKDLRKEFAGSFEDDFYYTGKLLKTNIAKDSLSVSNDSKEPIVYIDVLYEHFSDKHYSSDQPELFESEENYNLGLTYNEDDKDWTIVTYDAARTSAIYDDDVDSYKGSGKLYGPSEKAVAQAQEHSFIQEMSRFIEDYTEANVDAINLRDFSYVSSYITDDGPRRKEADEYIDYLDSKDFYEEWYGSEVEKVEEIEKNNWKVTVLEEFDIIRPDETVYKAFKTVLLVKKVDGELLVHELLETNEI